MSYFPLILGALAVGVLLLVWALRVLPTTRQPREERDLNDEFHWFDY